jgi:molybdate transport repressor ModE-like protein
MRLLALIDEKQSIKDSCIAMGMSYSKGWKLIGNLEGQLGHSVITRIQGGRNGGGAYLTDEGKELVSKYNRFSTEAMDSINAIFRKYFADME